MITINHGISFLIWHICSDEMYLVKSNTDNLEDILNIMAYIQYQNFIACPNFEMSVKSFCEILNKYFHFQVNPRNYFNIPRCMWKKEIGHVIKINYNFPYKHKMRNKKNIFLLELTALWSTYKPTDLPKYLYKGSDIGNIIQIFVKTLPNAQPWL